MSRDTVVNTNLNNIKSIVSKAPLYIVAVFLSAFLLSATNFGGNISPFPIALISVFSGFNCIIVMAGSLLGLLISGQFTSSLALISGLLIIMSVRIFISGKQTVFSKIIMSAVILASNLFIMLLKVNQPSQLADAIVNAVCSVTFYLALNELLHLYSIRSLSPFSLEKPKILGLFMVVYSFSTAILASINLGIINIGAVFAGIMILFSSEYYGFFGGAAMSVPAAIGLYMGGVLYKEIVFVVALGGIFSGFFKKGSKITRMLAYVFAAGMGVLLSKSLGHNVFAVTDCLAASAVYLIIPSKLLKQNIHSNELQTQGDYKGIISEKLKFASATVNELKQSIEKTASVLDKNCVRNISWVSESACDRVCSKCKNNSMCWGKDFSVMMDSFGKITQELRKGKVDNINLPPAFIEKCINKEKILSEMIRLYRQFIDMNQTKRRVSDMRWILSEQLLGTQRLLLEMSKSIGSVRMFDSSVSIAVQRILVDCGISEPVVGAVVNSNGRMSIEAFGKGVLECTKEYFCELVMASSGKSFDLPEISYGKNSTRITMYERATYSFEMEIVQLNKGKNRLSGDYCDSYIDESGVAYIALSDGMGSGTRARVDSTFTCGMLMKLIRCGVGLSAATKIVNSSMSVKSVDESYSTLDICKIDLYTGAVNIYKAGSAPTYLKSRNRIIKIPTTCPPIGNLSLPELDRHSFSAVQGDIVLLVSDGVMVDEGWLTRELKSPKSSDIKDLVKRIAMTAKLSAEKSKDDDITVAAIKIVR
ncbi:MAG: SpoIIE family protein phosphatase [Clostridiales bacterium]|nr:SpoIIE family protein phosphatase [Clostridiales bacterium]